MQSQTTTPKRFWGNRYKAPSSPDERFWSKVEKTSTCWLWTGCTNDDGYGYFFLDGRMVRAHRWAYEQEHGPIPGDLQCDHLCRVRACVRPSHIELVTRRENILRGECQTAQLARATHCVHGHLFDVANTHIRTDGRRRCRECHNRIQRERRKRLAAGS